MAVKKEKKILISGNEAMGEAAIQAGCRFYAGYPITPQNELTAYMARRMPEEKGVFIQAESEIAAVNMVFGASASGARAFTTSSSPGISLKQEGISYLAGCQLPAVIINVMRAGPGLGNIAPSQSDYFQATKGGGHGDYRMIVLAPSSTQEAFYLTALAFDLADKYRNPVMILSDAFLGQMAEAVELKKNIFRSKSLSKKSWSLSGAAGRKPNVVRSLFLEEGVLEEHNKKLQAKYEVMRKNEERFEVIFDNNCDILIVSYGISFRIARGTSAILAESGIKAGFFRPISLWPFPYTSLKKHSLSKKAVFVFELSSGQMVEDVRLALGESVPVHFYGRLGGGVFSERELADFIKKKLNHGK